MPIGAQRNVPGTGFVSLNDYLGANGDALNAQFANDAAQAHGIGDSFNAALGGVEGQAEAPAKASGIAATPPDGTGTDPYSTALGSAEKAQSLGTQFGSEAGMAGSAANPVSGEQSFNAALEQGAHGQDYSSLAGYLGGFSPSSVDAAWNAGSMKGIGEYTPPVAPAAPGTPDNPTNEPAYQSPAVGSQTSGITPWPYGKRPPPTGAPKQPGRARGGHIQED